MGNHTQKNVFWAINDRLGDRALLNISSTFSCPATFLSPLRPSRAFPLPGREKPVSEDVTAVTFGNKGQITFPSLLSYISETRA